MLRRGRPRPLTVVGASHCPLLPWPWRSRTSTTTCPHQRYGAGVGFCRVAVARHVPALRFVACLYSSDCCVCAVDLGCLPCPQGKGELQLLHNITGSFRPGVLTALMGVSGAGKTTLMDVLAGRKTVGRTEGQIWVGHSCALTWQTLAALFQCCAITTTSTVCAQLCMRSYHAHLGRLLLVLLLPSGRRLSQGPAQLCARLWVCGAE